MQETRALFFFANSVSLFSSAFLLLSHAEQQCLLLFRCTECMGFLGVMLWALLQKSRKKDPQILPVRVLYLLLLAPVVRSVLSLLPPRAVYAVALFLGVLGTLPLCSSPFCALLLPSLVLAGQMGSPSVLSGFIFAGAICSFITHRAVSFGRKSFIRMRGVYSALHVTCAWVLCKYPIYFYLAVAVEGFFCFVAPAVVSLLHAHKKKGSYIYGS